MHVSTGDYTCAPLRVCKLPRKNSLKKNFLAADLLLHPISDFRNDVVTGFKWTNSGGILEAHGLHANR
jgi:hypothetical protein